MRGGRATPCTGRSGGRYAGHHDGASGSQPRCASGDRSGRDGADGGSRAGGGSSIGGADEGWRLRALVFVPLPSPPPLIYPGHEFMASLLDDFAVPFDALSAASGAVSSALISRTLLWLVRHQRADKSTQTSDHVQKGENQTHQCSSTHERSPTKTKHTHIKCTNMTVSEGATSALLQRVDPVLHRVARRDLAPRNHRRGLLRLHSCQFLGTFP